MLRKSRNAHLIWDAYAPFIQKINIYFKIWKNSEQKFHTYVSTFYVRTTKFRGKPIFSAMCKKDKACHV
jgi:hypothetical protein